MDRNALTIELIQLASAYHTGEATEDERARLERVLEDNPEARAIYLRIADDTVTLNDVRHGSPLSCVVADGAEATCALGSEPSVAQHRRRWMYYFAAAAASLLVA